MLWHTQCAGKIQIQTISTKYNCRATCDFSKQLTLVTDISWREIRTNRNGVIHLHASQLKRYSHMSFLVLEHASVLPERNRSS